MNTLESPDSEFAYHVHSCSFRFHASILQFFFAFPSKYPLLPSFEKTVGAPDRNLTNTFNRKNEVILRFAKHHTLLLTGWKLGMDPSLDVLARIIFRVSNDVNICTSSFPSASLGQKKRWPCFQIIPHNQGMIHKSTTNVQLPGR